MTKYRELVNRLNRTEDAVSINGRYPAPGLMSEAARAIESLEEEVGRLTDERDDARAKFELTRVSHNNLSWELDRRVAEERERCETIVSNLHRIISEPYVDPSDKYNTPEAICELHGNLVFIALDAIRSRSNGDSPTPPVQEIGSSGGGEDNELTARSTASSPISQDGSIDRKGGLSDGEYEC